MGQRQDVWSRLHLTGRRLHKSSYNKREDDGYKPQVAISHQTGNRSSNSRVMMPDIARELRRIMGILWEYGEITRRIVVRQIARKIQRSCETSDNV